MAKRINFTKEEKAELIEYIKNYGQHPYAGYSIQNRKNADALIDEITREREFKRTMKTITPWEFINLTQGNKL